MHFRVIDQEPDGDHHWCALECECHLTDDDPLLVDMAKLVREAYGEQELLGELESIEKLEPDPLVADRFDLSAVLAGFRFGLPDPEEEKSTKKARHLHNYRSEAAEMVSRGALAELHGVKFPAHPQKGKVNANQPQLGFDGWGISGSAPDDFILVLIQTKATDSKRCPPEEASKLASECCAVPRDKKKLCRALTVLALQLKNTEMFLPLVALLARLGRNEAIPMIVAPVIVRGVVKGCLEDLTPVRKEKANFSPAVARGLVITLGVELTAFGERVMTLARAA